MTLAPASLSSRRARWLPTLPKPWITMRPPLSGIPKSRAYSSMTYDTLRAGPLFVIDGRDGRRGVEGTIHQRGLPGLDRRQPEDFVVIRLRVVPDSALARAACAVVLNAVAGEHLDSSVVHPHRHLHLHL